jgi:hypothetical protein
MPALAYAALIRIVRSLEESDLYRHEVEVLRGAADARLLGDLDRYERMAEAEELLGWLVEQERMDPEVAVLVREQLQAITAPAAHLACQHRVLPQPKGSLLGRAFRALLGLPGQPSVAPKPKPVAPAPAPAPVATGDEQLLDDATLAALTALDELAAGSVESVEVEPDPDAVPEVLDAAGRPFDPDRLHDQAEKLLAFHAWLDANDRR